MEQKKYAPWGEIRAKNRTPEQLAEIDAEVAEELKKMDARAQELKKFKAWVIDECKKLSLEELDEFLVFLKSEDWSKQEKPHAT